jgi:hypothetical protein
LSKHHYIIHITKKRGEILHFYLRHGKIRAIK